MLGHGCHWWQQTLKWIDSLELPLHRKNAASRQTRPVPHVTLTDHRGLRGWAGQIRVLKHVKQRSNVMIANSQKTWKLTKQLGSMFHKDWFRWVPNPNVSATISRIESAQQDWKVPRKGLWKGPMRQKAQNGHIHTHPGTTQIDVSTCYIRNESTWLSAWLRGTRVLDMPNAIIEHVINYCCWL